MNINVSTWVSKKQHSTVLFKFVATDCVTALYPWKRWTAFFSPSSDSLILAHAWIFNTMSTASSVVSVDETTLAITSSFRSGNMTDKWRLMVWESSHGSEFCPGTSWMMMMAQKGHGQVRWYQPLQSLHFLAKRKLTDNDNAHLIYIFITLELCGNKCNEN